ncbi:unnamed protein product, partial [Rotaria sp. Silwood1]
MNLLNIVKHLLYLTQTEFGSENSSTTADEILTAERLFEVLKSINVSYFTELYTYDTLDLDNEYDELTNEEQSNDDINDYNENEHSDINDHFTLEEMEKIVEWVDQHPNAGLETISHRFKKYTSYQILNSDHCSFQQEYISPRTLSFTGERTIEVVARKKYNVTHSYTIQSVTSANGLLLDKFLLELQEKENTLGKRVQKNLIIPPNVVVRASKSGKSNDENHHAFLNEVMRPFVGKKFLLFLDAWKTQADLTKFRAVFPHPDSQLLIFPEGSTGYIQPQDLSLFRSWRFIHEKIEHYTHINRTEITISDRQYFINIHSVIHNQLSAPPFKNLIKNGFIQARITNETIGQIEKPKD